MDKIVSPCDVGAHSRPEFVTYRLLKGENTGFCKNLIFEPFGFRGLQGGQTFVWPPKTTLGASACIYLNVQYNFTMNTKIAIIIIGWLGLRGWNNNCLFASMVGSCF